MFPNSYLTLDNAGQQQVQTPLDGILIEHQYYFIVEGTSITRRDRHPLGVVAGGLNGITHGHTKQRMIFDMFEVHYTAYLAGTNPNPPATSGRWQRRQRQVSQSHGDINDLESTKVGDLQAKA